MAQNYFYNGYLRWTILWENPNCWAAFLACLVAWVWCGQTALRAKSQISKSQIPNDKIPKQTYITLWLIALYIVEAGIWFLLVKTYSRGGLVAAVVAMVFFFGLRGLRGTGCQPVSSMGILPMRFVWHGRPARVFGNIFVRIALVALMCLAVGFASRMSPDYVAQDKSILNRMDQWKGAMVMISDSPFHGWGYTLGGMAYQDWYQPLSHTTRPIGFVNSYLEVAVEQGSQVLFLAVVCASALLLITLKHRKVTWVAAAGASLVAWLVSNLWSSIWLWPGLWILPGVAVVCILVAAICLDGAADCIRRDWRGFASSGGYKPPLRILAASLAVGIVVWVAIVGAGHVLAKDFSFQAKPVTRGDAAIVSRRGKAVKSTGLNTELWVDAGITRRYWGKSIRTILENNPCGRFIVYATWALRENRLGQRADKCVYSGFQAELLSEKDFERKSIIILHPTVYPPVTIQFTGESSVSPDPHGRDAHATQSTQSHGQAARATITVCLPAFDASPYNLPWRRWAVENGAKLVFSPQEGTRIDPDQNKEFWRSLLFDE